VLREQLGESDLLALDLAELQKERSPIVLSSL
jgi:hypothetical protein